MLKRCLRIAGIQSLTIHPAKAGKVKYNTSKMNESVMDAHRSRAGCPAVEFGNQRQSARNVKCLTYPHQRPCDQEFMKCMRVSCHPSDRRPDKKAPDNDTAPAESIGNVSAERTEQSIDPLKPGQQKSPVRFLADAGDIMHDRELHRGQHLAIQVVQQRNGPTRW